MDVGRKEGTSPFFNTFNSQSLEQFQNVNICSGMVRLTAFKIMENTFTSPQRNQVWFLVTEEIDEDFPFQFGK